MMMQLLIRSENDGILCPIPQYPLCEGFHNSPQYQWAWSAIKCYKRFMPLILHQLVVGWIGKAHGLTSGIRAKVIGSSRWSRIVREGL